MAGLPKGITGIQGGARWSDLEGTPGAYDFSLIDAQLEACRRHGKRFFCTLAEKTFNRPDSPAPGYIASDYDGVAEMSSASGKTARIWEARVLERFCLLIDELGAKYDGDPYFVGIEFMETAFNCDPKEELRRGFAAEDYDQAYKTLLGRARKAFPTSVIIQEINYLPSGERGLAELAAFCAENGIGLGGPDLYPDKERDRNQRRIPAYDFFPLYAGEIPLASDVQYPEYAGSLWIGGKKRRIGEFTPQGILDMALGTLKLNYVFWCAVERQSGLRFGFSADVLPMLEATRWAIHKDPPASIRAAARETS